MIFFILGYNHTLRFKECSPDNLALLVLNQQFSFHKREPNTEYIINRVRYGVVSDPNKRISDPTCRFYGWGSRRNVSLDFYLFISSITNFN